jgi:multiple sugar transport system substrate-binding protein
VSIKMLKGIFAIIAAASLFITSACNKPAASGGSSDSPGSSDTANGGIKTITISILTNEPFFDLIKQKFEAAHPNIKVNFKVYNATPVDKSAAGAMTQIQRDMMKFVDTISTEMASGKGSDLLLTNYLPYKKYADKHLLANMDELMKNDPSFDRNNYYMNVFDAMKYKDGYYALPTSVQYTNIWMGNSAILGNGKVDDSKWSWQDFVNQVQPLIPAGGSALNNVTIDDLLGMMLNPGIGRFIDTANKKATFDSPEFINLLDLAKSMIDTKIVSTDVGAGEGLSLFSNQGFFRYLDDLATQPQTIFDGKGALYKAPSIIPDKGYSYRSNFSLAINDKSKNKQEAWEFIKFALSDEIQTNRAMRGMPVSKSAFHQLQTALKDPNYFAKGGKTTVGGQVKSGGKEGSVNGKEVTLKPPTAEEVDRLETFMTGINSVQETDNKLESLVYDELAPFLSGQKSAAEAAKAVQSKVNTYLNE